MWVNPAQPPSCRDAPHSRSPVSLIVLAEREIQLVQVGTLSSSHPSFVCFVCFLSFLRASALLCEFAERRKFYTEYVHFWSLEYGVFHGIRGIRVEYGWNTGLWEVIWNTWKTYSQSRASAPDGREREIVCCFVPMGYPAFGGTSVRHESGPEQRDMTWRQMIGVGVRRVVLGPCARRARHLLISFPPGRGGGRARGAERRVRVCDCDKGPFCFGTIAFVLNY